MFTSLRDEGQIGGISSIVGETSGLLVLIWGGEVVRELAGSLEYLSFVIRSVFEITFGGDLLDLVFGVACVYEGSVCDQI
jgi:hypothetical protein